MNMPLTATIEQFRERFEAAVAGRKPNAKPVYFPESLRLARLSTPHARSIVPRGVNILYDPEDCEPASGRTFLTRWAGKKPVLVQLVEHGGAWFAKCPDGRAVIGPVSRGEIRYRIIGRYRGWFEPEATVPGCVDSLPARPSLDNLDPDQPATC